MLIDQLPEITDANDADEMPIEQGTTTRKIKILNLLKGVVKKAGDTMSGDLLLSDASCISQDSRITSGTTPSSNIYGRSFYLNDSQRFNIGTWQIMSLANGREGFQLVGSKKVNNVNKYNYIRMLVDTNGNPVVELNGAAAWRSALGLGTSGTLPITIAQGGTGAIGTNTTQVVGNIITAGANISVTGAKFAWWGKLAQIDIAFKANADIAVGATLGTLGTGKRPIYDLMLMDSVGQRVGVYSAGNITTWVAKTSGSQFSVRVAYLLP